jgi:SpoIID/LytB domain protein
VGSDGKLSVVNAVAADALLSGLVPSEMFPDAPMEALRAQSIAARTELLQKLGVRHFGDPFLLCATQHCQVYSGAGHEHPRTTKAVRSTRGQVLVTKDDELVDARYSATCGGHSEHNEVVWGGDADSSLRGVLDGLTDSRFKKGITDRNIDAFLAQEKGSFCANTRYSKNRYRWEVKVGADELSKQVAKTHPGVGRLQSFKPLRRGISGRITRLRLVGDKGSTEVEGELVIRRLLGGLRSSLFTSKSIGPKDRPTSFEFRGAGFGHGVGMCQLGAIGRASAGQTANEILSHYYNDISLHRLY